MSKLPNPQYVIGIDLGTTHCAVSYSDLELSKDEKPTIQTFMIPQLSAPGKIEYNKLLPSFIYLPHKNEMKLQDVALPWQQDELLTIGEFAREKSASTPNRVVTSAKSWLCQENLDKRSGILPQNHAADIEPFSPLQATIYYLEHIKQAWDYTFPENPLSRQQITLTIPASFDPSSRELTAEAARLCDYENLTLLEEPQAAFYSWLEQMGDDWKEYVNVGDVILVIDVGGGTTDFSLIMIADNGGDIEIKRIAVGHHILIGGDNMDLMLAHIINARFAQTGQQLEPWQIQALTHSARQGKEKLLANNSLDHISIVIPGRTSRLIGKSIKEKMTREDVQQAVLDGFFPEVEHTTKPIKKARSGITRMGLNYAQDAAITKHIAEFLSQHTETLAKENSSFKEESEFAAPSAVLFNGGVFKSKILRDRVLDILNTWLAKSQSPQARELPGANYDNAVAIGAATYGHVKNGNGIRIKGGSAQAFYLGLESPMPAVPGFEPPLDALCIAPLGMEEDTTIKLKSQEFGLIIGEEVSFRFFGSTIRSEDDIGTILSQWHVDELVELPGLDIILKSDKYKQGDTVPVYLSATQTAVGTLILKAHSTNSDDIWDIEFNIREKQREIDL